MSGLDLEASFASRQTILPDPAGLYILVSSYNLPRRGSVQNKSFPPQPPPTFHVRYSSTSYASPATCLKATLCQRACTWWPGGGFRRMGVSHGGLKSSHVGALPATHCIPL